MINTATNQVTTTLTVGIEPYVVAITPNSEYAYVTNSDNNTITVINTATKTLVATTQVGAGPFGVAITPNGDYAYVTNDVSNTVSVVSNSTAILSASSSPTASIPEILASPTVIVVLTIFILVVGVETILLKRKERACNQNNNKTSTD